MTGLGSSNRAGPQPVRWALFSLKGRIRRQTYAWGVAFIYILWWAALARVFFYPEGSDSQETWLLILGFCVILTSYCLYALAHKRLQDIGYSGFWMVAVAVIVFAFPLFSLLPLIVLALLPGQAEDNKFGPRPVKK